MPTRQGRKLRRFWRDGEDYREWKRRKSVQLLLEQPRAQLAVNQLWQQLIQKVKETGKEKVGCANIRK